MPEYVGQLSGRLYTEARPFGFAPWKPNKNTLLRLNGVLGVIKEYSPRHLTVRQHYYRLESKGIVPKTAAGYNCVQRVVERGRRSGKIPWDAIRDDDSAEAVTLYPVYADADAYIEIARRRVEDHFRLDRMEGQEVAVEVWCETMGMVPQLQEICDDYGIRVSSSGGMKHVTQLHTAAVRISQRDIATCILLIGDHDEPGLTIMDRAIADVNEMTINLTAARLEREWRETHDQRGDIPATERDLLVSRCDALGSIWRHVAVTEDQIEDYNLATDPTKAMPTVQAEALDPDVLETILRDAVKEVVDLDKIQTVIEAEARMAADLLDQLPEVG